jgi:hypothetical protein
MISIESLELFHDTLPHLISITFFDSEFKEISVPENIRPATRIKVVFFELSGDNIRDKVKLLQYINKKYPNIEDFSFIDFDDYKDIPDSDKDGANSILQEGLVPLLSRSGPQFRKLTINFDLFDLDHLKALSTTQCQIESFGISSCYKDNILENLTDIPQFSYLQSLHIRGIQPSNFRWLKKLTSLKSLKLRNRNKRFCDFENIIRMCNDTLESITLRGAWIQPKLTSNTCFIRDLTIAFANFGSDNINDVDHFITYSCPRLKILKLHSCVFRKELFDFSSLDLAYFELIQYDGRAIKHILVRTEDDKQGHWYFINHTSHHLKSLPECFSPQESRAFLLTK